MARMKKSTKVALAVGGTAALWWFIRRQSSSLSGLGAPVILPRNILVQVLKLQAGLRAQLSPAFISRLQDSILASKLSVSPDYDSTFQSEVIGYLNAADARDAGLLSSSLCRADPNGALCARSRVIRQQKYDRLTAAQKAEAEEIERSREGWLQWLEGERLRQEQDAWVQEQIQASMDDSQDWGDAPGYGENSNDYGGDSPYESGA